MSVLDNFGFGTLTPERLVHILGPGFLSDGSGDTDVLVQGAGAGSGLTLQAIGAGGRQYTLVSTANAATIGGGKFGLFDASAEAYRFVVDAAGRFGFGVTTPDPNALLDMNGRVRIRGGDPGMNKLLSSNATGLASWSSSTELSIPTGSGVATQVMYWTGPDTIGQSGNLVFESDSLRVTGKLVVNPGTDSGAAFQVASSGADAATFLSTAAAKSALVASGTGGALGVSATSDSAVAVLGASSTSVGGMFSSSEGRGLVAITTSGSASGQFQHLGSTGYLLELRRVADADASILFLTGSTPVPRWTMGVDHSASQNFVLSSGPALGTNDILVMTPTGIGIGKSPVAGAALDVEGPIHFGHTNTGGVLQYNGHPDSYLLFSHTSSERDGFALSVGGKTVIAFQADTAVPDTLSFGTETAPGTELVSVAGYPASAGPLSKFTVYSTGAPAPDGAVDVNSFQEYAIAAVHPAESDLSTGIAFYVGTTTNPLEPGAAIVHQRTGAHSMGRLLFKIKTSTAASGVLKTRMSLEPTGDLALGGQGGIFTPLGNLHVKGRASNRPVLVVQSDVLPSAPIAQFLSSNGTLLSAFYNPDASPGPTFQTRQIYFGDYATEANQLITGFVGFHVTPDGGQWKVTSQGETNYGAMVAKASHAQTLRFYTMPVSSSPTESQILADGSVNDYLRFGISDTGAVSIGTGATPAHASALLELASTSRGLLLPRMTKNQRSVIAAPAVGLAIYQTDYKPGLRVFNGTVWVRFTETPDL